MQKSNVQTCIIDCNKAIWMELNLIILSNALWFELIFQIHIKTIKETYSRPLELKAKLIADSLHKGTITQKGLSRDFIMNQTFYDLGIQTSTITSYIHPPSPTPMNDQSIK